MVMACSVRSGGNMDLTKVTPLPWTSETLDAFTRSVQANPWGPFESPEEVLGGSVAFLVEEGATRVLLAVRPLPLSHGRRLDVVGLAGQGSYCKSSVVDAGAVMAARQFGCSMVAMQTQNPKVARGALREGWTTTGAILTKWINTQ